MGKQNPTIYKQSLIPLSLNSSSITNKHSIYQRALFIPLDSKTEVRKSVRRKTYTRQQRTTSSPIGSKVTQLNWKAASWISSKAKLPKVSRVASWGQGHDGDCQLLSCQLLPRVFPSVTWSGVGNLPSSVSNLEARSAQKKRNEELLPILPNPSLKLGALVSTSKEKVPYQRPLRLGLHFHLYSSAFHIAW